MAEMKSQCFLFSWKGQYNNVCELENQLDFVNTIVINSDETNTKFYWITLNDSCYFSDQFRKALALFDDSKYDFFVHIQADVSADNWQAIFQAAQDSYQKYQWGIYAPNVIDSFYVPSNTDIFELEDKLMVVATPDCSAWFIHKDFIREMKNNLFLMKDNFYGWGFDLLIAAFAHLQHRPVIRDYHFTVNHPASTGYKKDEAETEMITMIRSCPKIIQVVIITIKTNHRKLAELYGRDERTDDNIFIYNTTSR